MSKGRTRSSPVYLAAARDRLLAFLRAGRDLEQACAEIGVSQRTLERYCGEHRDFAAKVARAKRGEETEREQIAELVDPPGPVTFDAVPVPCVPCDAEAVPRPGLRAVERPKPPGPVVAMGSLTRGEYDEKVAEVLRDPKHPHFASMAKMVFPLFYGAELLALKRAIEHQSATPPGESLSRSRLREILERAKPV